MRRKGGVAQFWRSLRVATVTCHNRQDRRRGYVTFGGTAEAECEASSTLRPQKGLNFQQTEGKGGGVMQVDTVEGGGEREREKMVEIRREDEEQRC